MEERIIDNEREIKNKRRREGVDAVDALADGGEEALPEEELVLELPEEEYDEDLVGLTPSQLKEELERRERALREAREESEKLTLAGAEKLGEGAFEEAESFFAQALTYDPENAEEEVRAFVKERAGARLEGEREAFRAEERPLREKVEESMEFRRGYFRDNRNYFLVRFGIFFGLFALCLVGAGISASFIYSTRGITPIVLIACFGGAALVMLAVAIVFARKLVVANRLCRENEKLSSTEDGARLAYLQDRLHCLDLVLDGAERED